jgi:AAA domain
MAELQLPEFYTAEEFLALGDADELQDEEPFEECELAIVRPAPAIAAALDAYPADARERKRLFTLRDLTALPEPLWLVENLIPAGGRLVGLSGFAGVGKTFAALDLALSVACSVPWLGRPVLQSPVLYVPLEGLSDLRTRIDAWFARHDGQAFRWQAQRYFHVLATSLALDTDQRIFPELRAMPRGAVIIIDTFTRALSRASENDASELRPALNRLLCMLG